MSASCPRVFAGDTDEFMMFLAKKTVNATKPTTAAARTQIMPMIHGSIPSVIRALVAVSVSVFVTGSPP